MADKKKKTAHDDSSIKAHWFKDVRAPSLVEDPRSPSQSWPKSIYFVLLMGFLEGFIYLGTKSLLFRYMIHDLKINSPTLYFDIFYLILYGSSLFAWKFSNKKGKYLTILISFWITLIGSVVVGVGIWIEAGSYFNFIASFSSVIGGFSLMAIGIGGLKSSLILFGFDQLEKRQESVMIPKINTKVDVEYLPDYSFIRAFYFLSNFGGLLAYSLTFLHEKKMTVEPYLPLKNLPGYLVSSGILGLIALAGSIFCMLGFPFYNGPYQKMEHITSKILDMMKGLFNFFRRLPASPESADVPSEKPAPSPNTSASAERGLGLSKKLMFAIFALPFGSLFQQMSFEWIVHATKTYHDLSNNKGTLMVIREDNMLFLVPLIIVLYWPIRGILQKLWSNKFFKLFVGLALIAISFSVASSMDSWITSENKRNLKEKGLKEIIPIICILMQSYQYLLFGLGEMLFVLSGLEIFFGQITTLHTQFWLYWLSSKVMAIIFTVPLYYYLGHVYTTIVIAGLLVPVMIYANNRY